MSEVIYKGVSVTATRLAETYSNVMHRFQIRLSDMSSRLGIKGGLVATSGPKGEVKLCIDGRPKDEAAEVVDLTKESLPVGERRIHFPGGVYGIYVAVQKQTGLSAQETVDVVGEALGQEAWIHTDDHSKHEGKIGCAYTKALLDPKLGPAMGVNPDRAREIWDILYPHATVAEYRGPHKEGAAFIVKSSDITVMSPNEDGQDFVYDQARMNNWITTVFGPNILQKLPTLDVGQLWKDLDAQAVLALQILTAPKEGVHNGLPIYELSTKRDAVLRRQV
ncbi:MAG TPA: hypothetical protein VFQ63_03170 [Patescibacteria group bacterium]|nr:hypothetical protein [Patescibacteria group bacterium]